MLRRIVSVLIAALICLQCLGTSALANGLDDEVNAGGIQSQEREWQQGEGNSGADVTDNDTYSAKECCYEQDGQKIVFELGGAWETGHNVTITIYNDGDHKIENWSLLFDYPETITDIWNAELITYEDGRYEIKNAGWNKDILEGSSVTFGFACNELFQAYPEDCHAVSHLPQAENMDNDIEVVINDVWDSGCTGYVTIKNNSDSDMEDWSIEFDCPGSLESVWDGQILSMENGHYVVKNAGYNYNIEARSSVSRSAYLTLVRERGIRCKLIQSFTQLL